VHIVIHGRAEWGFLLFTDFELRGHCIVKTIIT
jgi:hypothetical protein